MKKSIAFAFDYYLLNVHCYHADRAIGCSVLEIALVGSTLFIIVYVVVTIAMQVGRGELTGWYRYYTAMAAYTQTALP